MSNISNKAVSNTNTQPSTEVSVEITGGKPTTTSLDVAKHFGKQHKDVLRAIRNLDCSTEFHERNFAPTIQTVLGPKGAKREEPAFRMTRDGFTFLCMGFTGKEAARWKEAYINAFNKMEQALIEQPEILSHNHLLQFAIKTLDLMRDHTLGEPARPRTEQVVCNYLAVESLDAANPEQIKQALNFLQGQIIGEGVAAKSLPSVAGSSIAKDLLYGLLRSAHDAELLFNSLYDSGVEKLASEVLKEHMANTLAATSRQTRELLGYVASRATRSPFKTRSTH
ncbi:Rha family transcriptional regulator [Pseudomonas aeruginosa]|nr:Rha family transcriptional regulator [Pseudomonas aeruginosa]EKY1814977.1 Rha family transcriptional regulator [Pseudomonas aeruginosa]